MFTDTSHYIQLVAVILTGIIILLGANISSEKNVLTLLMLLIPFQIIDSKYGSINVVLTYIVCFIFLLHGRIQKLPLIGSVLIIFFSYLLSLSQREPGTLIEHGLYLVGIGSDFLLFYMVYNYFNRAGKDSARQLWKILIIINILVLGYCTIQLIGGLTGKVSLGIDELSLNEVRGNDRRLTGPFRATALTAEYLCIQIVIVLYAIYHSNSRRNKRLLWLIFTLNCGFLVTTGNRGGIVTLVIGILAFLYLFRKELGRGLITKYILAGILMFSAMSVIVIKYTDFNVLFERIESTEIKGGIPDSRQGWIQLMPRVFEKPVLGHGPRLMMSDVAADTNWRKVYDTHMPYPHNAPMFLIYTVGLVGLFSYLVFYTLLLLKFIHAKSNPESTSFTGGVPRVAIIILIIMGVSELRIEMFRFGTNDYQQFVMMLLGGLLASLNAIGLVSNNTHSNDGTLPRNGILYKKQQTYIMSNRKAE